MTTGLPLLLMLLGLPGAPAPQEVRQYPRYTIAPEGGSIAITCCTRGPLHGIYLKQLYWPEMANVIYYEDGKESTVDVRFSGRIAFSGPQQNLTVTVHRLQSADMGTYVCQAVMRDSEVWGQGTVVVVTDALSQAANTCQEGRPMHVVLPVALAVGFLLIGLSLGVMCVLRRTQIKELCRGKDRSARCVVYEDMSCSRHDTMSTPCNLYQ